MRKWSLISLSLQLPREISDMPLSKDVLEMTEDAGEDIPGEMLFWSYDVV